MVTFNISGLDGVRDKISKLTNIEPLLLDISSTLNAEVKHRVHVEGLAADGSRIGTYSDGYMKVRTGNFKNPKITRGNKKGQARPAYNRGADRNVILSLTRQMEMDFGATQPIKIEGGYGIGFTNDLNYNKAVWNEKRYGKTIYGISQNENQLVENIINKYVNENG